MDMIPSPNGPSPIEVFLSENEEVRFLRMQWVDLSGVLRTRIVTKSHCLHHASDGKFTTLGAPGIFFPVSPLQFPEVPACGTIELQPDWSSLRLCQYARAYASVMCFTSIQPAKDPYYLCPRTLLAKALTNAKKVHNVEFLVGFEVEFALLDPESNTPDSQDPVEGWSVTAGLRRSNLVALEEIIEILEASNIAVEKFHTEGEGQIEIATGPLRPMEAIDALMYTHETIKHVFWRHKLRATMAPLAWPKAPSNGAHTHISMSHPSSGDSFLAGMLEHIRVISSFGLSNFNSFIRVQDFRNGTGSWVCWGTQNRDVPIRKIKNGHWELRCVDGTANFYLFLSLVLSAGLLGLDTEQMLVMGDCLEYPGRLGKAKLAELGVHKQLPRSMREAIEILKVDTAIDQILSSDLKRAYVNIKELDEAAFGKMSDEERRLVFVKSF